MFSRFVRPLGRARAIKPPISRLQHSGGAHKEYFQHPSQFPVPVPAATALTTQIPLLSPPPIAVRKDPSILRRLWRSMLWAGLFGTLGITSGTALITWDYLLSPLDPESEEEMELFEDILVEMNEHPLVMGLSEEPNWAEQKIYEHVTDEEMRSGLSLLTRAYLGSKGVHLRQFTHRLEGTMLFVVYIGDGVEGWPDTAHGGIIMTLLKEAMERNANIFGRANEEQELEIVSMEVNFLNRVQPGSIYAIMVQPGFDIPDEHEETELIGGEFPKRITSRKMQAYLAEAEGIPVSQFSEGAFPVTIGCFAVAKGVLSAPIHVNTKLDHP